MFDTHSPAYGLTLSLTLARLFSLIYLKYISDYEIILKSLKKNKMAKSRGKRKSTVKSKVPKSSAPFLVKQERKTRGRETWASPRLLMSSNGKCQTSKVPHYWKARIIISLWQPYTKGSPSAKQSPSTQHLYLDPCLQPRHKRHEVRLSCVHLSVPFLSEASRVLSGVHSQKWGQNGTKLNFYYSSCSSLIN